MSPPALPARAAADLVVSAAGRLWAAEEDIGKAGPVGLFLIVSLLVVVFFLGRSMRTHLRRVPTEFPDPEQPEHGPGPGPAGEQPTEGSGPADRDRPQTPRPRSD